MIERLGGEDNKGVSGYLFWPNLLKICAIFSVVLIHSAAPMLIRYHESGAARWWIGNLYDSFGRWCIPLFLMLSGTFIIEKATHNLNLFFKRRSRRVLLPLVIWSAVYFLWRVYVNGEDIPLRAFPALLLEGPVFYHLWFLYVLVILYLLAPILGVYLKKASLRNVAYLVGLWLLLGSFLPMVESFFGFRTFFSGGTRHPPFNYVGYFVLGYLLRDKILVRREIAIFALLFLLAFLVTAWGTYRLTVVHNGGTFDGLFYEYFSANVLLMAIPVYLLGKSIKPPAILLRWEERFGLVSMLAACVPGIYLSHALLISAFKRGMLGFRFDQTSFHPAIGVPFFALVVFMASLLLIIFVKRIPGIKYLVP